MIVPMQAIILSIGDELVLGQTVDTNSAYLSAKLAEVGITTRWHQTIADDRTLIADAIRWASNEADLVIITGGIGPTDDDLTRQALADAMQVGLIESEVALEQIQAMFKTFGRAMPERNRIQAMHPAGTEIIENKAGTAPGIRAKLNRAAIYVTPGVPREMQTMYERSIVRDLRQRAGNHSIILTATIHTFGVGESSLAEMLGPLCDRARNPKVGTTVAAGICSVRIRSEFPDAAQAKRELDATIADVERAVGPIAFGRDEDTLQSAAVTLLKEKRKTVATAESCTGGLIGKLLTDVPGSSAVYAGGWVTYTNELKHRELGVPRELLDAHGAVSGQVVRAMADGAIEQSGADLSLAVTGIAGPDGGTPDKPVGTVWIALGYRDAAQTHTQAMRLQLPGTRQTIRDRAARCALQMLRLHLLNQPLNLIQWGQPPTAAKI